MAYDNPEDPLSEGELAALSAIEVLLDVMLASGIRREVFQQAFEDRIRQWDGLPKTVGLLQGLQNYVRQPRPIRDVIERLLKEPPQGGV
jgi:hypothetical protein